MSRLAAGATAALLLAALVGCGAPTAAESPAPVTAPAGDGLTEPQRWPSLPALSNEGLLTLDEVTTALPAGAPYGLAIVDWASAPWQFPWCDDGALWTLLAAPPPRDQEDTFWAGEGYPSTIGAPFGAFASIHAVRWEPTGADGVASAQQWGAALRDDACFGHAFGPAFLDYYVRLKEAEVDRFLSEVTEWEHAEYFALL